MPSLDEALNNDNHDEIEMLEIPVDTSDTGSVSGMSDAEDSGIGKPFQQHQSTRSYPSLQNWLKNDGKLQYVIDKNSQMEEDTPPEFQKMSTEMYKSFEKFSAIDLDDIEIDEPIGLITNETSLSSRQSERQSQIISDAMSNIIETFAGYLETLDEADNYDYLQALSILECLQALCFYDDVKVVPEQLSNWINKIDPKPDVALVENVMINTPKPYLHSQFWNTYLPSLVVRGLHVQAVNAIEKSGYGELADDNETLYRIIQDLSSLITNYTTMSLKLEFNEWKLRCCEFRDTIATYTSKMNDISVKHGLILSQVYDITCIMTGLPKTIANFCDTWYEMFVALSFYQVRYDHTLYKEYFELSIEAKSIKTIPDQWEEACYNILKENYLKALTIINSIDSGTAAYVSRLLELNGYLKSYYSFDTTNSESNVITLFGDRRTISEYLITKYAFQCLDNESLVPIGVGLLLNKNVFKSSQSQSDNRKTIADFLPHMNCQTNDDLEWALTICAQLNLKATAQSLYLKYGQKSLRDGYIFESMNMFVNCYNPEDDFSSKGMKELHRITWDLVFQDALLNSRPIKDELINNIVFKKIDSSFEIHPIIRQCLSPYAVLCEFYRSLSNNNESLDNDAMSKCSKLIHLLRFNYLPKKFYPLLLCQFIPVFKNDKLKYSFSDLMVIVELINEFDLQKEQEKNDGQELYRYAINHIEEDAPDYDWRLILKSNEGLPTDAKSLIKVLRNEICAKIGRVYIEN